jgi:hypothetical protein
MAKPPARNEVPIGSRGSVDDIELLWRLYADNRTQAQFHESQRATATAVVAGGAGALMAAIFATKGVPHHSDFTLAAMILLLGCVGYVIARKGTEKLRLHNKRCRKFLQIINDADPTLDVVAIKAEVDRVHIAENWLISQIKLSTLWHGLHLIIIAAGLFLCWYTLFRAP